MLIRYIDLALWGAALYVLLVSLVTRRYWLFERALVVFLWLSLGVLTDITYPIVVDAGPGQVPVTLE